MQIDLSKRFREGVRKLPKPRRREIARVIDAVADLFRQRIVRPALECAG